MPELTLQATDSTLEPALRLLPALSPCKHLELHPTKTKMVYCNDGKRKATYPNVKFDFLGYCFRPRWVKRLRDNTMFCDFNPAVSPAALKIMRSTMRDLGIRHRTQMTLADIAPLYTMEEFETLHAAMLLMARRQGLIPEEEGEDVAG